MKARRWRQLQSLAAFGVGAGAVCLLQPAPASADVMTAIGGWLGKPLGGFLESASAPTMRDAEGTTNRVIANVDGAVDQQITHVGSVAGGLLNTTNDDLTARLGQADGILAARLAQVDTSGHALIGQAIGGLSATERQTMRDAGQLVANVDGKVKADLDKTNGILESRIQQVNGAVSDAISQADQDMAARISQVDEVAQKSIGSVDVVASKQTLNLEAALIRVGVLLGMVAFTVALLRFLFTHIPTRLKEVERLGEKRRHYQRLVGTTVLSFVVHAAAGAACIGGFFALSKYLPQNAQRREQVLTQNHEADLRSSLLALDLTKVRCHAAELAILNPGEEAKYRAVQSRAELIRAVLTRPGLLATAGGLRQVALMLQDAARAQMAAGLPEDSPDLLAVAGYVRWQLATTRIDELAAAMAFGKALDMGRGAKDEDFVLRPLCAEHLGLFLARPLAWTKDTEHPYGPDDLRQLAKGVSTDFEPLLSESRYDTWVLDLDRVSTKAYVAMLDAHADLVVAAAALGKQKPPLSGASRDGLTPEQAAVLDAKAARLANANAVIDAWAAFDRNLAGDSMLSVAAEMTAFTLNDAPLAEALWFASHPDAVASAPAIANETDPGERAKMAPVRVAWARRYLASLGSRTQNVATYEAAERYQQAEAATVKFENDYIAYRVAVASDTDTNDVGKKRDVAALDAAALGFYLGGTRLSDSLLSAQGPVPAPSDAIRNEANARNDTARLRLL